MTLKEAVKEVIRQNKSIGYLPSRFISITQGGNADNLGEVVKNLVLKAELLEELEKAIKKYGDVLTIEDLISNEKGSFNMPDKVKIESMARSEWFKKIKNNI